MSITRLNATYDDIEINVDHCILSNNIYKSSNNDLIMKKEDAVKALVAKGATLATGLVVTNATVNFNGDLEKGFISLKVNTPIKSIVEGKETEVNYLNVSLISACAALKDQVGSGVYHHVKNQPFALEDIFDGSTISICQLFVKKDDMYENPFSDAPNATPVEKDTIFNNIVDVTIGKEGAVLVKQIKLYRNFGGGIISGM